MGSSHLTIVHSMETGGTQDIADIQRQSLLNQTSEDTGFDPSGLEAAHQRVLDIRRAEDQERRKDDNKKILELFTDGPGVGVKEITSLQTTYAVRSGDTLGKIASQYGTTVPELAKLNNITDVDKIKIGQAIKLPGSASTELQPSSKVKPIVAKAKANSKQESNDEKSDNAKVPEAPKSITELQSLIQKNEADLKEMRTIIANPETTTNDRTALVTAITNLDKNNSALKSQLLGLKRGEAIAKVNNEKRADNIVALRQADNAMITPNEKAIGRLQPIDTVSSNKDQVTALQRTFTLAMEAHKNTKPDINDATPQGIAKIIQYGKTSNSLTELLRKTSQIGSDLTNTMAELTRIQSTITQATGPRINTLDTLVKRHNDIVMSEKTNTDIRIAAIQNHPTTIVAQGIAAGHAIT